MHETTVQELVLLYRDEPMTTSLAIAEGTGNTHKAVIQLVRKYVDDLQEFGPLAFEMLVARRPGRGGEAGEVAFLNEQQATLLITYMRNSEIVRRFKVALVKAFYELRDRVRVPPAGPQSVDHRADVLVSADRTFRAIMRAGRSAGLRMPQALARANDITRRETGVDMLRELDAEPLAGETAAQSAAWLDPYGSHVFCDAWMDGSLPFPLIPCRSEDFYSAYRLWCAKQGIARPAPLNKLIDAAGRKPGISTARKRYMRGIHVAGPHGVVIPHGAAAQMPPGASELAWLGKCIEAFGNTVRDYKGGAHA